MTGDPYLGRRCFIPSDPVAGAHALAEVLGGRVATVAYLRTALAELERRPTPTGTPSVLVLDDWSD